MGLDQSRTLSRIMLASPALTTRAVRLLGRFEALRDRNLSDAERWSRRTSDELGYWRRALAAPGARERFADRLDPRTEISLPVLCRALDELDAPEVTVLDLGSGPLTSVGKTYPGTSIQVIPVDPLADEYRRILLASGLEPPVMPVRGSGETLVEQFGRGCIDVAFASNTLDHTIDPLPVLENMLAVIKPNGRVALSHMRNEAARNGYMGLHAWNLDCRGGRFVVGNRQVVHDVGEVLDGRFEVECWSDGGDWIQCLIRPRTAQGR